MPQFEPVKGTTWERTTSVHAGSLYMTGFVDIGRELPE